MSTSAPILMADFLQAMAAGHVENFENLRFRVTLTVKLIVVLA